MDVHSALGARVDFAMDAIQSAFDTKNVPTTTRGSSFRSRILRSIGASE